MEVGPGDKDHAYVNLLAFKTYPTFFIPSFIFHVGSSRHCYNFTKLGYNDASNNFIRHAISMF